MCGLRKSSRGPGLCQGGDTAYPWSPAYDSLKAESDILYQSHMGWLLYDALQQLWEQEPAVHAAGHMNVYLKNDPYDSP